MTVGRVFFFFFFFPSSDALVSVQNFNAHALTMMMPQDHDPRYLEHGSRIRPRYNVPDAFSNPRHYHQGLDFALHSINMIESTKYHYIILCLAVDFSEGPSSLYGNEHYGSDVRTCSQLRCSLPSFPACLLAIHPHRSVFCSTEAVGIHHALEDGPAADTITNSVDAGCVRFLMMHPRLPQS